MVNHSNTNAPTSSDNPSDPDSWVEDSNLEVLTSLLGRAVVGLQGEDGEYYIANPIGSNCAESFRNETFAIRDYCWCDGSVHPEVEGPWTDEHSNIEAPPSGGTSTGCPINFEHLSSGVRATWYKNSGRDLRFSRHAAIDEALHILQECLTSVGQALAPAQVKSAFNAELAELTELHLD